MEGKGTTEATERPLRRKPMAPTRREGAGMAMTPTFAIFWLSPDRLRQNRNSARKWRARERH